MKKVKQFFKNFISLRKKRKQQKVGTTFIIDDRTSVLDVDLLDKQTSPKGKKKVQQYTKILVSGLSIAAVIWITYSYVLATIALFTYQNANPLSDLSQQVCITILGVVISYCLKAFFETYAQAKHELEVDKFNSEILNSECSVEINDDVTYG